MKRLLFSLTKKDFKIATFCTGGPGGQHQNSNQNGVRITHLASGAFGEGREFRSQAQNKKAAFERMARSVPFQKWHKVEVSRRLGQEIELKSESFQDINKTVEESCREENLKVEYYNPK
jgi:protein subunit release factor A